MQRHISTHQLKRLYSNANLEEVRINIYVKYPLLAHQIQLKVNLVGLTVNLYPMSLFIRKVKPLTGTALLFGDKG